MTDEAEKWLIKGSPFLRFPPLSPIQFLSAYYLAVTALKDRCEVREPEHHIYGKNEK
jgi:hypothetical protein